MILNLVLLKDSGGYPQFGVLNLWKGRKSEIYFNLLDQKSVIIGTPADSERSGWGSAGKWLFQTIPGLALKSTEIDLIYSIHFPFYI